MFSLSSLPNRDVAARYGGEEFAIILPATGRSLTRLVAERLRATVEEARIEFGDGRVATMTISIGLATLHEHDEAITLAERADAALYRAKQNGRNRVEEW
jgi:diguanylate cyclase